MPPTGKTNPERVISPLQAGDKVEVIGMAPESDCQHEIFVIIQWEGRTLGVPLSQLKGKTVVLAWFPKAFTGG